MKLLIMEIFQLLDYWMESLLTGQWAGGINEVADLWSQGGPGQMINSVQATGW